MPRPRATRVLISPGVRERLHVIVRKATAAHRLVQRARLVLFAGGGMANAQIAQRLGMTEDTVRLWRDRFAASPRVGTLRDHHRSGRPPRVATETRVELIKLACSPPPPRVGHSCWTHASLRAEVCATTGARISTSEVGRILRNEQLRPHRMRLWLHSPDPEFRAKAARVCRLYMNPPPGATVLCVDEKTQIQALRRRFPSRWPTPGELGRYEFEYRRGGVLALLAAFNVATGNVFAQCSEHRGAADLLTFMEALAERHPHGTVYIIWDNLDIHRDGKDGRWKAFNARHGGRFRFVFTPKHASWLNQVEIWFSILQRRVIRYGDFIDVNDVARKLTTLSAAGTASRHTPSAGPSVASSARIILRNGQAQRRGFARHRSSPPPARARWPEPPAGSLPRRPALARVGASRRPDPARPTASRGR
jgi:transposase